MIILAFIAALLGACAVFVSGMAANQNEPRVSTIAGVAGLVLIAIAVLIASAS